MVIASSDRFKLTPAFVDSAIVMSNETAALVVSTDNPHRGQASALLRGSQYELGSCPTKARPKYTLQMRGALRTFADM